LWLRDLASAPQSGNGWPTMPPIQACPSPHPAINADLRDGVQIVRTPGTTRRPHKDGLVDFGKAGTPAQNRGSDIMPKPPASKWIPMLFSEYDLARAPVGPVPSAWIGYDPDLALLQWSDVVSEKSFGASAGR